MNRPFSFCTFALFKLPIWYKYFLSGKLNFDPFSLFFFCSRLLFLVWLCIFISTHTHESLLINSSFAFLALLLLGLRLTLFCSYHSTIGSIICIQSVFSSSFLLNLNLFSRNFSQSFVFSEEEINLFRWKR